MKLIKYSTLFGLGAALALGTVSCKNADTDFPDHQDGVSAYFAHQYPVRTIVLGDFPEGDNSLDNQHKCMIYATQGGAYKSRDLKIDVVVDPSLTDNLTFDGEMPVKVMPESYYSLASTTLTKKKDYLFGTEVSLSDAFFADAASLTNTYVIPLRMTAAVGADRILSGTAIDPESNPARCDASAWSVLPQDYVLYCVKFVNKWHSSYLRRGTDIITDAAGVTKTVERRAQYVEQDEVVNLTTAALDKCIFPVSTVVEDGESLKTLTCELILTFNGNDCTVTTSTPGMTASGSGKYVPLGDKNSWGNKDRDALYLDYEINFGPVKYKTEDILVLRARDIAPEYFTPVYNK